MRGEREREGVVEHRGRRKAGKKNLSARVGMGKCGEVRCSGRKREGVQKHVLGISFYHLLSTWP